jgi:predicted NAD/FAD-dependent oxidoreductase
VGDNQHKGISAEPAVTIHGSPAFSRAYLEAEPKDWVDDLVAAAQPHLGSVVIKATGHRWRFAQPQTTLSSGCEVLDGPAPIVLAGEVFAGARVEGAFTSGAAAAAELIERLG